jgi:hypothetical protein
VNELRSFYKDFHPDARALLDACESVLKSALYEREPLSPWSRGAVTLLGDACHPMLPFMAQGAGMAIEDAVVLGRCLSGVNTNTQIEKALATYATARQERTAKIQIGSRGNQWMKTQGNADWVYSCVLRCLIPGDAATAEKTYFFVGPARYIAVATLAPSWVSTGIPRQTITIVVPFPPAAARIWRRGCWLKITPAGTFRRCGQQARRM